MQFFLEPFNLVLIAVALISGSLLAWPLFRERLSGPSLSTLAVTQLMNARPVQVLDIRAADQFAAGSLPNARNIPLADVRQRNAELKKERPVIVVCDRGRTSSIAAAQLRTAGFKEVYVLSGGLNAWRDAGLPLRR